MTTKLTGAQKGGVAIAIVVALALVLLVLMWPRSSSAAALEVAPIQPKPVPPAEGPDPYHPKTEATQGQYCIPWPGDGEIAMCTRAGLSPISAAWRTMRDHPRNAWIARTTRPNSTEKQLDLDWGYAHMTKPGFELLDWAWNTPHVGSGNRAICLPYVPTQQEVNAA
jgi:hypothetical protein